MKQIFIAALALAIFVTGLLFVQFQTLSVPPKDIKIKEDLTNQIKAIKDNQEEVQRLKIEQEAQERLARMERHFMAQPKKPIKIERPLPQPETIADQLKNAAIAYTAPKEAIVDEPLNIILRIDPTATVEQLKQMMPAVSGDIIAKEIKVSQIIRAELTVDETEFRLVNLSPNEQALFVSEPNIWQWELTALKAGKNHITISITALVHVGDHETNHFITAYSDDIIVTSTTKQKINALYDKHKDKLWGFLIVPAFEWARRRFNKWRENKKSEQSHDA